MWKKWWVITGILFFGFFLFPDSLTFAEPTTEAPKVNCIWLPGCTDTDIANPKNNPKNLKVLAAQCLLLASKFNEVQRVYPAEIVY